MPPVVPKCLALVLCESVSRSEHSHEPSVVRAFDVLAVPSFPAITSPFTIWLQVTDGNGWTRMKVVIEHVPSSHLEPVILLPLEFSLNFRSPNAVLEHEIGLDDGIELERMGRYRLRLVADGITIAQRYFVVLLAS